MGIYYYTVILLYRCDADASLLSHVTVHLRLLEQVLVRRAMCSIHHSVITVTIHVWFFSLHML